MMIGEMIGIVTPMTKTSSRTTRMKTARIIRRIFLQFHMAVGIVVHLDTAIVIARALSVSFVSCVGGLKS